MLATRPPESGPDDHWDQKEMPFTEHLRELRQRLMVCVGTVLGIAVLALWPAQQLIPIITRTYFHGIKLNAFGPADAVWAIFKLAIYIAVVIGLPVLLYQIWMFVVPAIHPRTRRHVYRYIWPTVFLAAGGIVFAHYLVMPRVIGALLAITDTIATPVFGIESTINLVLLLFLAFALIFQTPVIMVLLARIGLVNVSFLRKNRRYIGFGMFTVAALLAPDGSPITMMLLGAPMYVLFESSIWIIVLLERRWKRDDALT